MQSLLDYSRPGAAYSRGAELDERQIEIDRRADC